jgi:hypothetical protein
VLNALDVFARGTGKYFGVATVFGGIVAVLDGAALVILGIPAAGLWALVGFVTNYVPNIGFIIGLVPPANRHQTGTVPVPLEPAPRPGQPWLAGFRCTRASRSRRRRGARSPALVRRR